MKASNGKFTGISFNQVAIPCRPQKTFTLFVFDVPEDLPEEDIRHSLYKFNSVVEVVRLIVFYQKQPTVQTETNAAGELLLHRMLAVTEHDFK